MSQLFRMFWIAAMHWLKCQFNLVMLIKDKHLQHSPIGRVIGQKKQMNKKKEKQKTRICSKKRYILFGALSRKQ